MEGPNVIHQPAHRLAGIRARRHQPNAAAFTLVEILIVVVILGILAAIVVPQFTSAAQESRENALKMDLHRIRQQIEIYSQQHGSNYPDSALTFAAQMTMSSNVFGETAAVGTLGYPLGPYLRDIPVNPFTGGRTIGDGEPGTSDWYYADGDFRANDSELHREF
jgi:general secretion pathway protein G